MHENRTQQAIFEEQYRQKTPTLTILQGVLGEIAQRQQLGLLRKDMADKDKNRIALRFISLHDKVKNNQLVARTDNHLAKLNHKEREKVLQIRLGQEDAIKYQQRLESIIEVQKKYKEISDEAQAKKDKIANEVTIKLAKLNQSKFRGIDRRKSMMKSLDSMPYAAEEAEIEPIKTQKSFGTKDQTLNQSRSTQSVNSQSSKRRRNDKGYKSMSSSMASQYLEPISRGGSKNRTRQTRVPLPSKVDSYGDSGSPRLIRQRQASDFAIRNTKLDPIEIRRDNSTALIKNQKTTSILKKQIKSNYSKFAPANIQLDYLKCLNNITSEYKTVPDDLDNKPT